MTVTTIFNKIMQKHYFLFVYLILLRYLCIKKITLIYYFYDTHRVF